MNEFTPDQPVASPQPVIQPDPAQNVAQPTAEVQQSAPTQDISQNTVQPSADAVAGNMAMPGELSAISPSATPAVPAAQAPEAAPITQVPVEPALPAVSPDPIVAGTPETANVESGAPLDPMAIIAAETTSPSENSNLSNNPIADLKPLDSIPTPAEPEAPAITNDAFSDQPSGNNFGESEPRKSIWFWIIGIVVILAIIIGIFMSLGFSISF